MKIRYVLSLIGLTAALSSIKAQSNIFKPIITGNYNDSIVGCKNGQVWHGMKNNVGGLELYTDIGLGILRNELSPNLYGSLRFFFNEHQLGFNLISYFTFNKNNSDNYRTFRSTFIGIEYLKHQKNHVNKGFGFNYLKEDEEDIFENSTFMFMVIYELKYINIRPTLLVTDNFNTAFPMVTVSFSIF